MKRFRLYTTLILTLLYNCASSQDLVFEKTYPFPEDPGYSTYYNKVLRLENGNTAYITMSIEFDYNNNTSLYNSMARFAIFDQDANLLEDTAIARARLYITAACSTSDGGFAISCRIDTANLILKFDQQLHLQNSIALREMPMNEVVDDITEYKGDFYIKSLEHHYMAYEYFENAYFGGDNLYYKTDIKMSKINSSGNLLWETYTDTTIILYQIVTQGTDSAAIANDSTYYLSDREMIQYLFRYLFLFDGYTPPVLKKNPYGELMTFSYLKTFAYRNEDGNIRFEDKQQQILCNIDTAGTLSQQKVVAEFDPYVDHNELNLFPADSFIAGITKPIHNLSEDTVSYTHYILDYSGNRLDSNSYSGYNTSTFPDENIIDLNNPACTDDQHRFVTTNFHLYAYDPELNIPFDQPSMTLNFYDHRLQKVRKLWATIQTTPEIRGASAILKQTDDKNFLLATPTYFYWNSITFYKLANKPNQLTVSAYIDLNNNGVCDSLESRTVRCNVEISNGVSNKVYSLDINGKADIALDSGVYVSHLISYHQNLNVFYIFPDSATSDLNGSGLSDSVLFRLVPKAPFQNLEVNITPNNGPRPGFRAFYTVNVSNFGTHTATGVRVTFLKDSLQVYDSITLAENIFSGDTLVYMFDSIPVYGTQFFLVTTVDAIPPTLHDGDTLHVYATVTGNEADSFPADNIFLLRQGVRNSYDPNDKSESHGNTLTNAELQARDYLYYTIRFQNTGTDYATRVQVKDTLSEKLDWNTLQMVASSHLYVLDVTDKRYLTWTFDNIYLLDSTSNELNSHGYITFRIKPKTGLSVNDVITNRASIIFDYNPAVVTNTVTTSIIDERVTIVHNHEIKSIKLYPSPASDHVTLEMNITQPGSYELQMADLSGKNIYSETLELSAGQFIKQVSLENLPKNLYLIAIHSDNNEVYSGKVLKQ